ncbi:MAG: hypothetical protein P1U78_09425 [Alcanivoracaceae bacterium]|jgi:hypothetical protein|nr:hypothetical protein [Alcanivoracaceae bacterium]MDF1629999.1 hypothetical protein [Alcanivoracaceae bacterium]MDX5471721.1 hypothetical protein [Marinobacter sp.]PKM22595.1 MAG: hypothetical protein CVV10_03525 [Gammaproteobacteria bacterium HGW-Gammaproteobacteria-14]
MSAVKVMSIIGMIFFPICLLLIAGFAESDVEAAAGWGVFASIYGIGYAITTFVKVKNVSA